MNPSMLAAATAAHQASLQAEAPAAPDTSAIGPLGPATAGPPGCPRGSSHADSIPSCSAAQGSAQQAHPPPAQPPSSSSHAHAVDSSKGQLHEVASSASLSGTQQHAAEYAPSILRQTAAALGLWEQLHETASTPSTVLSSQTARLRAAAARAAVSTSTDQSAA